MAWWSRTQGLAEQPKKSVPKGIWTKCERCNTTLYEADLDANLRVCASCNHHFRMPTQGRIEMMIDEGSWIEHDLQLESTDPLGFRVDGKKYVDQIKSSMRKVGPGDAYRAGTGAIGGIPVEAGFFVFEFMGGSMGSVVGERFVRGVEAAIEQKTPFVSFTATGGARMQEGLLSLMQMAKTNASLTRLAKAKLPYISVLTDPTMGGVSASFAFMGDVVIAEPKALIGFAGPRVIENTVREKLPEGFQRAEFLLTTGAMDMIVDRRELRASVAKLLAKLQRQSADAIA